jgi:Amt family ammonium transporter
VPGGSTTSAGTRAGGGSPTAVGAACGVVSGLVGITPAAGAVTNMWAYFFGFFTALCVFFVPKAVKLVGIDDRLDCFAFHGIGGIVGSLLTGLFAARQEGAAADGAFYFNAPLYGTQIAAVLVTVLYSVITTSIIYWVLWAVAKAVGAEITLPAAEQATADVSQHGERAYYKGAGDVAAFEDGAAAPAAKAKVSVPPAAAAAPAIV